RVAPPSPDPDRGHGHDSRRLRNTAPPSGDNLPRVSRSGAPDAWQWAIQDPSLGPLGGPHYTAVAGKPATLLGSVPEHFSPKITRGYGFGGRPSHSGRPLYIDGVNRRR